MKTPVQRPFLHMLVLSSVIILTVVIISFGSLKLANSWNFSASTSTPDPFTLYDPAQYGIPEIIAGYKVLAVTTSENTACLPPGTHNVVLQASQNGVENFLQSSSPENIYQELQKFGNNWGFSIVGPNISREQIQSTKESWNAQAKINGCIKLANPIPTSAK